MTLELIAAIRTGVAPGLFLLPVNPFAGLHRFNENHCLMKQNTIAIQEAMAKLNHARLQQRHLKEEIDTLRELIFKAGGNPDAPKTDNTQRDKEMYKQWKDGKSCKDLGKEYRLSTERIRGICKRIDKILEMKKFHFIKYRDLLPYYG